MLQVFLFLVVSLFLDPTGLPLLFRVCGVTTSPVEKPSMLINTDELDDSAFFRTQSYITEHLYFEYPPSVLITLFRITHLTLPKSYLVIICPIYMQS